MPRKKNYTTIPNDYVRFFLMDGNGNNITGSNNATVTNATWSTSSFSYIKQQLSWGAYTGFTYSSFAYTNSYLIKNGELIKNSGEVGATALSGVNGNAYQGLIFFNRTLTAGEELSLTQYVKRKLGPTNAILSGDFPLYSLPNLEKGKLLEISKAKVGSNYINQVDGSTYTAFNVTDSTNGKYNLMTFGSNRYISGPTSFLIGNTFTISASVLVPSSGNWERVISKMNGGAWSTTARGWNLAIKPTGELWLSVNSTGSTYAVESIEKIQFGKMNRIKVKYNPSTGGSFYIGGNALGRTVINGAPQNVGTNSNNIEIGRLYESNAYRYCSNNVQIANIKINNLEHTNTEAQQDFYSKYIN